MSPSFDTPLGPEQGDPAIEARYQRLVAVDPESELELVLAGLRDPSWRVRKLATSLLERVAPGPMLLERLIGLLGERDQTGARNAAAAVLGQCGAAAVGPVVNLLGHVDPDQRKLAADVLGSLGREEAVPALLGALEDVDANVRAAAAEALGHIGGGAATRALQRLVGSPEALLRVCALEGLVVLGAAVGLATLAPLVVDPATRRSAYRLLGQIAHPTAFSMVCRGLLTRSRDAALAGLGSREVGWAPEAEQALRLTLRGVDDLDAWLATCLSSADRALTLGAMHAVVAAGRYRLAPLVAAAADERGLSEFASAALKRLGLWGALALLEGEPAPICALSREARLVAAEAVTRVGEPRLVPALERLLRSEDSELAEVAVRALGRCRTAAVVPSLVGALDDEGLASAAARALVRIAASFPDEVAVALAACLQGAQRPHALRAYARVAPAQALAEVRRAAHASDDALRAAAAEAAGSLDGEAPVELLGRSLLDESPPVRRAAAQALSSVGRGAGAALLARALADTDPAVLCAACESAAELAASAHRARLEQLAGSTDGALACAALQALSSLGLLGERVLERACAHPDAEVLKLAVALSAERVGGIASAEELLTHARWDVRVAAARALAVAGDRRALIRLRQRLDAETDALAREVMLAAVASLDER